MTLRERAAQALEGARAEVEAMQALESYPAARELADALIERLGVEVPEPLCYRMRAEPERGPAGTWGPLVSFPVMWVDGILFAMRPVDPQPGLEAARELHYYGWTRIQSGDRMDGYRPISAVQWIGPVTCLAALGELMEAHPPITEKELTRK